MKLIADQRIRMKINRRSTNKNEKLIADQRIRMKINRDPKSWVTVRP